MSQPQAYSGAHLTCQVLLEEGASVRSVSEAMGFKDAFHFSRVFKSVHHVPPSRFRQSMHPQWPG